MSKEGIFHTEINYKQKEYDLFAINNDNVAYLDRPYEKEAYILQEELLNEYNNVT